MSTIRKIFEKIPHKQLFTNLNNNKLISKYESGFRPMHSKVDAMLPSTNEWYRNMDDSMLNITVFLDQAKAFDTVSHEIFTAELGFYGMQSLALNLISSHLENRTQNKGVV